MSFGNIMELFAGLSMFLYGMKMMGDGLEKAAGAKLRRLLEILTKNRLMGLLVGALFTAIIQSSSATTVMVVGFVNAGLMDLMQAAGVILGANIGTTITGMLVALKLTDIAPLFLLAGVIMIMFIKNVKSHRIGVILAGFGILFIGLDMMSGSMSGLKDNQDFVNIMTTFSNPVLALLAGLVVTTIIQSSSAAVGLIQVLALNGLMPLETAMFTILGTAIGTCVTALISSVGSSRTARRAALTHFLFNAIGMGVLLVLLQLLPAAEWIRGFSGGNAMQEIANANTIFKIFMSVLMFPFTSLVVKLTKVIIPGEDPKGEEKRLMYIDERLLATPPVAAAQLSKEIERMGRIAVDNLERSMNCFFEPKEDKIKEIAKNEDVINYLNHEITEFMVRLGQTDIPNKDVRMIASYYHVINDLERIGDHAENMCEFAILRRDDNIPFSEKSLNEMRTMIAKVIELCNLSLETFHTQNHTLLPRVLVMEEHIDDMEKDYQQAHVDRLSQGACTARSGMIFSDILSNLERVADHATNIAFSVENQAEIEQSNLLHS